MSQAPDWYADYYTQLQNRDEYESLVQSLHGNLVRLSHTSPWSIAPRPSSIFYNQARYQNYNWPITSSATTDSFNSNGIHRALPVWTNVLPSSAPKCQTLIAPPFNQQTPWPFGLPNFGPNSAQNSAQGHQVPVSVSVQQPTVVQPQSMAAAYPWLLPPPQLQPQVHQSASAVYANQANIAPEHAEVHSDSDFSEIDLVGVDIDEPLDLSVVRRDINEQHQPQVVPQGSIASKPSSFFNPAGSYRPLPIWPYALPNSVPSCLAPIALPLYQQTQWPTPKPLGDHAVGPNSGKQDIQINQIPTTSSGQQQAVVHSLPMHEMASACMRATPTPQQQSLQMQPGLIGNANQFNNMHDLASVHTQGHSSDVPLDLSVAQQNMCEKSQPQGAHKPQINELANNMQQQQRGPPRPPIFEPMFGEIRCVSCRFVFRQYQNLWLHMQREHPRLFARCGTTGCRRVLPNAARLIDHYNNDHPGAPIRLKCRFCEANFGSSRDLENHFQYFHHRGRFFCTHHECDFVAEFQSDVQRHYFVNHVQHTIAKQLTN